MEYVGIRTMAKNQVILNVGTQRRFYSYDTLICIFDYATGKFILSGQESFFTRTTVKWLNRFLVPYGVKYSDIKNTAERKFF